MRHARYKRRKKMPTSLDLLRKRLVLGRHAAHGVRDRTVVQFETVVCARVVTAPREAMLQQCRVQEHACMVSGEGPSGLVGAMQSGREPDNQQTRIARAEGRNGIVEVVRLSLTIRGAKLHETRTEWATFGRIKCIRDHGESLSALTAESKPPCLARALRRLCVGRRGDLSAARATLAHDHGFELLELDEIVGLAPE